MLLIVTNQGSPQANMGTQRKVLEVTHRGTVGVVFVQFE